MSSTRIVNKLSEQENRKLAERNYNKKDYYPDATKKFFSKSGTHLSRANIDIADAIDNESILQNLYDYKRNPKNPCDRPDEIGCEDSKIDGKFPYSDEYFSNENNFNNFTRLYFAGQNTGIELNRFITYCVDLQSKVSGIHGNNREYRIGNKNENFKVFRDTRLEAADKYDAEQKLEKFTNHGGFKTPADLCGDITPTDDHQIKNGSYIDATKDDNCNPMQ